MKKAEIIMGALSILALGLNLLLVPGSGLLTFLTLSILSIIYFILGFALFNGIQLRNVFKKESYTDVSGSRIIGAVGTGWALSATINGIMFKFQSWPGAEINLNAGLVGLLIVVIIGKIKYSKNRSEYYTRIFKRIVIFGGLGLVLMLFPKTSWVELKYRENPDYVDAYKKAMADPDNKELRENVEVERQKMNSEN